MTRQEANLKIIEKLNTFFTNNPDIRFFQGLQIVNMQKSDFYSDNWNQLIPDNFNEESIETLNNINLK
jgi:hypothetical protein